MRATNAPDIQHEHGLSSTVLAGAAHRQNTVRAPQLRRPLGTLQLINPNTIAMPRSVGICQLCRCGLWVKPWSAHERLRSAPRPTTMWRWRISGALGVLALLGDAAWMPEVGSMPSGPWKSRWSERRQWTGADDRRWWERRLSLLATFGAAGNGTDQC